jgi:uncharacterized membrane protein HdeD (DUF308 family)
MTLNERLIISKRRPIEAFRQYRGFALVALVLGILALLTPLGREEVVGGRAGFLLVVTAIVEFAHGFRRSTFAGQRSAWIGGAITLAMGLLLLNAPFIASTALLVLFAAWFGVDAIRFLIQFVQGGTAERNRQYCLLAALGNTAVLTGLIIFRGEALPWLVAIASALRIFGTASNILVSPVFGTEDSGQSVTQDLHLPTNEELRSLVEQIHRDELARRAVDRGWIFGFILTLFAIHLGRMGLDRTALGVVSPVIAVIGDIFIGLMIAFLIVIPLRVLWLKLTRRLERRCWSWVVAIPKVQRRLPRTLLQIILRRRLRATIRLRQARFSLSHALSRALQIGLPLAAIIAATFPVWGMSWYFDTENWAAGAWNSWAASRTDSWREAMVRTVLDHEPPTESFRTFAISPPGISSNNDFSFLVIGDTGEGDASQHSLRAQFLDVVKQDRVKFVVISSDVVYPTGAMRDYEAKFWLPFMGTTKPVYAIPGNHDWYDALEAFAATFYEPQAARLAIRARVELDKRITSTTDHRIEELIHTAAKLRSEYKVPTGFQKAPFFQLQTPTFALFAIDTGVVMRVDELQWEWFKGALESARGKTKMAILGHPLYAGGKYMAEGNPDFAAIHQLLCEHQVAIVMAGDTHDLEYYLEKPHKGSPTMHHFVNGGGGAYLSFGTSLAWPNSPATADWAYYPAKEQVVGKIEATTPWWKWPAWWWTNHMGGWPFSPEFLSAAFDVNAAPYYQSFMEVRVENSNHRIVLIPYGVHGRLRWADLDHSSSILPAGTDAQVLVEWVVEMK